MVPSLNVVGDEGLNELAEMGKDALADVKPNELRVQRKEFDQEKHEKVTTALADMEARLSGYFG